MLFNKLINAHGNCYHDEEEDDDPLDDPPGPPGIGGTGRLPGDQAAGLKTESYGEAFYMLVLLVLLLLLLLELLLLL